jgi:hypothetical protein
MTANVNFSFVNGTLNTQIAGLDNADLPLNPGSTPHLQPNTVPTKQTEGTKQEEKKKGW